MRGMGGECAVTLTDRRRGMMGQSSGFVLPRDFQPVEWISNQNSAVYFDTGYSVQMTDTIEIVSGRSANKSDQAIIQSNQVSIYQGSPSYENKFGVSVKGRSYIVALNPYVPEIGEFCDFIIDLKSGQFSIDRTQKTFSFGSATTTSNLFIFSPGSYFGYIQMRSLKVYDGNDSLIVNAIAGYQKSTNEILFYDTVSKTYLHALGTGTLTKGADI